MFLCCGGAAAGEPHAYLAVVEKVAGAVGSTAEDGRQLGASDVGPFPHEAVLSRDGKLSLRQRQWRPLDDRGQTRQQHHRGGGRPPMRKVRDIDLGRFHRPHGIALAGAGDRLLATTERPFGVILVDSAAGKVTSRLTTSRARVLTW